MAQTSRGRSLAVACLSVTVLLVLPCGAQDKGDPARSEKKYRGLIGADNKRIKQDGGKTLLWAGGGKPESPDAEWYEFTDALIPPGDLQFGIGKDRIKAIDDPLFVSPDDPRLLKLGHSSYRRDEKPKTADELKVIGYVDGGEARAYPVGLLDRHELVNDSIGGKPVTVGW